MVRIALAFMFGMLTLFPAAVRGQASGQYLSLATDQLVSSNSTLISTTINVPTATKVFVNSDGRYYPSSSTATGNVYITVDGVRASNFSLIQWAGSTNPRQHSYNSAGATTLAAGNHTIALIAGQTTGAYFVGAGSNLSIMTNPASQVFYTETTADSSIIDLSTSPLIPAPPPPATIPMSNYNSLPRVPQLSQIVNSNGTQIIALGSGRAYVPTASAGFMGDAMWGILYDNNFVGWSGTLGSTAVQWGVNDLFTGAELQAPMFTQAYFGATTVGNHTLSLAATEFPWSKGLSPAQNCGDGDGEDCVSYRVGAQSSLVVLAGGLTVRGALNPLCAASCGDQVILPIGTDFKLAQRTISIPLGHSGTVMMLAKARFQGQGANNAAGGLARLFLKVDNVARGSVGVQDVGYPNVESQRTLSASYMAVGATKLSVGSHTISVYMRLDGTFSTSPPPFTNKEIALIYFD